MGGGCLDLRVVFYTYENGKCWVINRSPRLGWTQSIPNLPVMFRTSGKSESKKGLHLVTHLGR